MATYKSYYHIDGSEPEVIEAGLTREDAEAWLREKSEECGQPVLPADAVNESSEDGCGYYAIESEED